MKHTRIKSLLFSLFVTVGFCACSQEPTKFNNLSEYKSSLSKSELITWHVNLPIGADVSIKDKNVSITMPDGVTLVGVNKADGKLTTLSRSGYTCNCEGKDGSCTPFIAGSTVGCSTDQDKGCSKCVGTKATTLQFFSEFSRAYYVHSAPSNDKGYLDGFATIQVVRDVAMLENLAPVDDAILSSPEVEEELNKITSNYNYNKELDFTGGKVPEGYSLIPVLIKEHIAYIVIPQTQVEAGMIEMVMLTYADDLFSTVSCSGCAGTCKLDSKGLGQVKFCGGCKSGCTISW